MLRFAYGLFLALLVGRFAAAGEYNPVVSIGDAAPEWKELPSIDGKKYSLSDFKGKDVVVLFFTCNSCDVATEYEDRIIAVVQKYAGPDGKAAFVAVNVNKIPEDSPAELRKRAERKKFPFVYLYDETQKLAKAYGATFTPEFFVLDRERKIAYMGGLDDHSNAALAKNKYLEQSLEALLAGKRPSPAETVAIGCMIRYERERRTKK